MAVFTYNSVKIGYSTTEELSVRINEIRATKIISIHPTTPEQTDSRQWVSVFYEMQL